MICTTFKKLENYCASETNIYSEFVGGSAKLHNIYANKFFFFFFFFFFVYGMFKYSITANVCIHFVHYTKLMWSVIIYIWQERMYAKSLIFWCPFTRGQNVNQPSMVEVEQMSCNTEYGEYKLYQNDWYWDMTEFSDFFFNMLWTNVDLNAYLFKISIVLSSIRILVYANSTFCWEITCY